MASVLKRFSDRLSRMSIRNRLMLYLLVGLVPIILITLFFFAEIYQARRQQVLLGHMAIAQATAGAVREFIGGIVSSQQIVGLTVVRENMTYEGMTAYFEASLRVYPVLQTLGFALPSGEVVAGRPPQLVGADVSGREYFREIVAGREWTVSRLLTGHPGAEPAFIIAHRIERDGQFAGVVLSAVSPQALQGFVSTTALPAVGYGILDSTGRIIVTTVLGKPPPPAESDRSWIPSVRKALKGKPAFAEPFLDRADGVRRMGASVPVTGIGWVVNVFEPVSVAAAPVRRAALIDLGLHLLIIAALLAVAWIVGTSLARPIVSLAEKADAVGRGDFSQRMEIRDQSELGHLANAFNNMTAELDHFSAEQREARDQALFLADVGELLTSTLDRSVALQTVVERTVEVLGDLAIIVRLEPDGTLVRVAGHARDPAVLQKIEKLLREKPPRVGSGVVGAAIERHQTVFVPRVSDLEDPDTRFYLEQIHAISTIAVPIRVRSEVVGALSVSSTESPLVEERVPIVEELARRLGIALENIRLYEDALERERFQRGLADLAGAVSSTLDTRVVLDAVCSQARDLLAADGVYIWVLQEEEGRLFGEEACGFMADEFIGMALPLTERDTAAVQAVTRGEGFHLREMPPGRGPTDFLTQKFHTQAAMFQPLISAGVPLGVMVIADTRDPTRFDGRSLKRAGLLAGYAATALANARAYERERRIAETLQRSLLPEVPDMADGYELAHFYTSARAEAAIGGDFYDFMDIGDGRYGVVVGDVSGKGLEAAVVTAMAKYVLRAYTVEDPEPVVVLPRANNAIVRYTAPDLFITLVYGVLNTRTGRFRYANAGHEPILVYRHSEKKVGYEHPTGMAAGIVQGEEYLTSELVLSPGDMLVIYTDGLTDARSPDGRFLDLDGLSELVLELAGRPAQEFLGALMDRVKSYAAGEFADDVAVVVVRAPITPK